MSRIIAGEYGGRRIQVPPHGTRPTSDRAREALFAALEHRGVVAGARVLDLYAGSGALGLEAISRGASRVVMVESGRAAANVCRRNASELGVRDVVDVVVAPVERYLQRSQPQQGFDLALMDPPYEVTDLEEVLTALGAGWLAPGALVVVERSLRAPDLAWPSPLDEVETRRYGQSAFWFAHLPASS
ncbi:MAG TPA: 16S rRNA (guanine(966)-N(2))-methyltransferase RsmD [Beutenbergiaceae bacterium]|nr:16S rRNA (guanine(966)-N(2))-methyltransferase RsmD [Beutenbergiaceae bacterium]